MNSYANREAADFSITEHEPIQVLLENCTILLNII